MKNKYLLGVYDYTVILTYLGMVFSFAGIIATLSELFMKAIICLMLAGVCDMFDGMIAATKKRDFCEKHFGIEIDSLCDIISFGFLPAIFVYIISGKNLFVGCICCIYILCGLIRLAFFNVQEYERQNKSNKKRDFYQGIPITTSAVVIPLVYLLYTKFSRINIMIFPLILLILGMGFIMNIKIKKPNIIGKIVMIIIGIIELISVFCMTGADIL